MKILKFKLIWLIYLIIFLFILYFSRSVFIEKYNFNYIEDLYFTSQWFDGTSQRIMSDNELYQYAGYKYLTGESLFNINPEVPPLGKYFYGLSILLFNNPYFISPALFIATFLAYYFLLRKIFKNQKAIHFALLLFLLSPIFIEQISRTMLDLPQLLFFLLHLNFILRINLQEKDKPINSVLAGLFLGLFASCKFPIYVPLILMADIFYLWQIKKIKLVLFICLFSCISYLFTFLPYFYQGNSLFDWIKAELWTIDFYKIGSIKENPFSKFVGIFFGKIKYDWFKQETFTKINNWSYLWPISIIASVYYFIKNKLVISKAKNNFLSFLIVEFFLFFIFFSFSPRYFLIIIPLGIIIFAKLTYKIKYITLLAIVLLIYESILFLKPNPDETIKFIKQNWEQAFYKDLYFQTVNQNKKVNFKDFDSKLKQEINYKPMLIFSYPNSNIFSNKIDGILTIYDEVDNLKYKGPIKLVRTNNRWKLIWDDKFI